MLHGVLQGCVLILGGVPQLEFNLKANDMTLVYTDKTVKMADLTCKKAFSSLGFLMLSVNLWFNLMMLVHVQGGHIVLWFPMFYCSFHNS